MKPGSRETSQSPALVEQPAAAGAAGRIQDGGSGKIDEP